MKQTGNRRTAPPPAGETVEPGPSVRGVRKKAAPRAPKPQASPAEIEAKRAARAERVARLSRGAGRVLHVARAVLGVCLALGVAGGLAWSARSYALHSARFAVHKIDISGQSRLDAERITHVSGIHEGMNVFAVRAEEARQLLELDPWVERAQVRRVLPDAVRIELTERKAAALVALGTTMLATRDGQVFKQLEAGDPTDLPVITCLEEKRVAEDPEGSRRTISEALDLLAEYEGSRVSARYPAEELCARPDGTFSLVVGKEGLSLRLGPAPYRRKLAQAERVLYELERRHAKADVVLLDNEARPDRVVVRVR